MSDPSVAIIGSRDPDLAQYKAAKIIAYNLSRHFCCDIWTGGSIGIDTAAMDGTQEGRLHVCLPWANFNKDFIPLHAKTQVFDYKTHKDWSNAVVEYHPYPSRLSRGAERLHARNYGIIKGRDLVIAFPQANGAGGTGMGIRIAKGLGVPLITRPAQQDFKFEELWAQVISASRMVPF